MDETVEAAALHPEVSFVVIQPEHGSVAQPENLVTLEFPEERAGFLAGAAAAMTTRTGRVAAVCEARFIDYVDRYCEGFAIGAKYVEPKSHAPTSYFGMAPDDMLFQDTAWGKAGGITSCAGRRRRGLCRRRGHRGGGLEGSGSQGRTGDRSADRHL